MLCSLTWHYGQLGFNSLNNFDVEAVQQICASWTRLMLYLTLGVLEVVQTFLCVLRNNLLINVWEKSVIDAFLLAINNFVRLVQGTGLKI